MEHILIFIIALAAALLFTAVGVYAWRRKKPMWFWIEPEIDPASLTDVPA